MKKSTIWILGVVMGLSFISLLYLQISYIEEMVKMRNEQFDESVKRALMAASKDVESAEVDRWLREDISEAEEESVGAKLARQRSGADAAFYGYIAGRYKVFGYRTEDIYQRSIRTAQGNDFA